MPKPLAGAACNLYIQVTPIGDWCILRRRSGASRPGFSAIAGFMKTGVSLIARTLAEKFPERRLWASHWPHPGRNPPPSEVALYDLLSSWAPGDEARRKRLVDNPAELCGFRLLLSKA